MNGCGIDNYLPHAVGQQKFLLVFLPSLQDFSYYIGRCLCDVFRCQRPQVPQLFSHDLHREQVYGQKERQETGQYAFPQFHSFFSLSLCIQTLVCASIYRTVPLPILQQNSTHFAKFGTITNMPH